MLGNHSWNIRGIRILAGSWSSGWSERPWQYQEMGNGSCVGGWREATVLWCHVSFCFLAMLLLWARLVLTALVSRSHADDVQVC